MPFPDDTIRPLALVQEHSLTSALKLEIERLIFQGKIKAGERINESTLAAHFQTSRGPLREAPTAQPIQFSTARCASCRSSFDMDAALLLRTNLASASVG